jgi:hypothetical protein
MQNTRFDNLWESASQVVQMPENYTQVTGIYTLQNKPQFLTAPDNVQHAPAEILNVVDQAFEQQDLRFFRML